VIFLYHSKNKHGVHSPLVYDFIINVLNKTYYDNEVEKERNNLRRDNTKILIDDLGTGHNKALKISRIAKKSLKKQKEASIIALLILFFKRNEVIELGTSLGITSAYIARSHPNVKLKTIEGSKNTLSVARNLWKRLNINSIDSFCGNFDDILPTFFSSLGKKPLFFIDGNHSFNATLHYYNLIKAQNNKETIIIFDDIHWSKGMEAVWTKIINDPHVTLSIDLFELGIIFFNVRIKKEHFILRY
jgi:predicted O-methyltransferase YrrM